MIVVERLPYVVGGSCHRVCGSSAQPPPEQKELLAPDSYLLIAIQAHLASSRPRPVAFWQFLIRSDTLRRFVQVHRGWTCEHLVSPFSDSLWHDGLFHTVPRIPPPD